MEITMKGDPGLTFLRLIKTGKNALGYPSRRER